MSCRTARQGRSVLATPLRPRTRGGIAGGVPVECAEASDDLRGPRVVQGTENGPPGKGGEAFLEVEGDQKEGALAALLEDDQVREELGHVARARLRPEPQNGRAEEVAMDGWGPGEGDALGPASTARTAR